MFLCVTVISIMFFLTFLFFFLSNLSFWIKNLRFTKCSCIKKIVSILSSTCMNSAYRLPCPHFKHLSVKLIARSILAFRVVNSTSIFCKENCTDISFKVLGYKFSILYVVSLIVFSCTQTIRFLLYDGILY